MYTADIVYFSHSLPYGVSHLSNFITQQIKLIKKSRQVRFKALGRTLGGQDIDIMEISSREGREGKKVVWMIGRQHAGEVTSSYMMEGAIQVLLAEH